MHHGLLLRNMLEACTEAYRSNLSMLITKAAKHVYRNSVNVRLMGATKKTGVKKVRQRGKRSW